MDLKWGSNGGNERESRGYISKIHPKQQGLEGEDYRKVGSKSCSVLSSFRIDNKKGLTFMRRTYG